MSGAAIVSTEDVAVSDAGSVNQEVNSVNRLTPVCKGLPATAADAGEMPYVTLNTVTVVDYVEQTLDLWLPLHGETRLEHGEIQFAEEVGDGNLNLVFRLLDARGVCRAVLKQALPYVRCVGESWPLTLDRNRLEARTLRSHYRYDPDVVERVLFHNSTMAVTALEDLSSCVIWRRELVRGHHLAHVAPLLGRYLGRVLFHTSDLAQDRASKKAAVQEFTNVDLCGITEDLFFTDPFLDHPRNCYEAAHEALVQVLLRDDAELKLRVAQLKHRFMDCPEAHLHGDLHSGSVFVDATRVKAIDAEFGFYGPMGFDLGTVVGNLLINYLALPALLRQRQQRDALARSGREDPEVLLLEEEPRVAADLSTVVPATPALVLGSVRAFWDTFVNTFATLAETGTRDAAFAFPGYVAALLQQVWVDALGFAGAEMIRRTVGLAHVADLDAIQCDCERLAAKEEVLRLGAYLIKHAAQLSDLAELEELVVSGAYRLQHA